MGRKICRIILVTFLLFFSVTLFAGAETTEELFDQQLESSGADELWNKLPRETREFFENIGMNGLKFDSITGLKPNSVLNGIGDLLANKSTLPLRAGATIVGIIVLCALMDGIKNTVQESALTSIYGVICALASSAAVIVPLAGCMKRVCSAVDSTSVFMTSFVPVYAAVLMTGGQGFTAAAYQTVVLFAAEIITYLITTIIVPLMTITLAMGLAGSVSPGVKLHAVGEFSSKTAGWLLGGATTIFVGLLSLQGIAGSAADTLTNKAIKFSISSFVPVVGGTLSEAFNAIRGCLSVLKSTIGGFGILATALIVIPPLLECIVWSLVLSFCHMASEVFGLQAVSNILKVSLSVVKMMIGVLAACSMFMIIATTIVTKAGMGT